MVSSFSFADLIQLGSPVGQHGEIAGKALIPVDLLPWAFETFASEWIFTSGNFISKYSPRILQWSERSGKIILQFDQIQTRNDAQVFKNHRLSIPKSAILAQAWNKWSKKQQLAFAQGAQIEATPGYFGGWSQDRSKLFWIYRTPQEATSIFFNDDHFVSVDLSQNKINIKSNVVDL